MRLSPGSVDHKMPRFRKLRGADDKKSGFQPPDLAMTFMLLGALCKFLELVVIREGIQRYVHAALGGLLIAIGSGLVTWNSIMAIRQASKEVSALKESLANGDTSDTTS
jgi:hypothetical protein